MTYQRDFEQTLRIGVVGVGLHSYRTILPALNFLPVKLDALCDLNHSILHKTGQQYGVSRLYTNALEMFADGQLDATIICVEPSANPEIVCAAFEAGYHVWMEKPPSVRAYQVSKMIEKRGDLIAVVGFKKIFMPTMKKTKQLLESSEAGLLKTILAEYCVDIPEDGRAILEQEKFNNWLASGCHPISVLLNIGGEVQSVITYRASQGGGTVILNFANGTIGTLHLADGMRGACERYSFYSENYHIVIDDCRKISLHRGSIDYVQTTDYTSQENSLGSLMWESQNGLATLENKAIFSQGFYSELLYFCNCILNGKMPTIGTLEFAKDVMLVYESALLSQGNVVEISEDM